MAVFLQLSKISRLKSGLKRLPQFFVIFHGILVSHVQILCTQCKVECRGSMILFAMHGGPVPREIEHYVMTGWFFFGKSYGGSNSANPRDN